MLFAVILSVCSLLPFEIALQKLDKKGEVPACNIIELKVVRSVQSDLSVPSFSSSGESKSF